MSGDAYDPEEVRRRLERLDREPPIRWRGREDLAGLGLEDAGVLVPLTEHDGQFHAIFTHRSAELDHHSGEVSFPGGRVEPRDDDLAETALREAHEEILLDPSDVRLYGAVVEMPTVTGFRITAWVGEFDHPYTLEPNPGEIETVFEAPLRGLADPAVHRIEQREYDGEVYPVHFYDYDGHTIWGATGYLVHELLGYLESNPEGED